MNGKRKPTEVVDVVREVILHDTFASCNVGSHKHLIVQCSKAYESKRVPMTNGRSTMVFWAPETNISAQFQPQVLSLRFIDGGNHGMVQSALHLASTLELRFIVILFRHNFLKRVELTQIGQRFPSWDAVIESTDIVTLAPPWAAMA